MTTSVEAHLEYEEDGSVSTEGGRQEAKVNRPHLGTASKGSSPSS